MVKEANFNSPSLVKRRLQAALYYARKKNRERRVEAATPPAQPQTEDKK